MSSAAAGVEPSRCASSEAEDGVWYGCVTVATRIASTSAGGGQVVGGLEGDDLDARQGALREAGERAGGRQLEQARHTELAQGVAAGVPPHRVGHLVDDPPQRLAAAVDDLAVGVGEQAGARLG